MITRILLAVDDSEGSLAAARVAIDLAARLDARLRVVNVVHDGRLGQTLEAASGHPDLGAHRAHAGAAVLGHVAELARRSGVKAETCQLEGPRPSASSTSPGPGRPTSRSSPGPSSAAVPATRTWAARPPTCWSSANSRCSWSLTPDPAGGVDVSVNGPAASVTSRRQITSRARDTSSMS